MGGGINNTQIVTEKGKYALDAVQNNPNIEGSLRNELEAISTNTKGYYKIGLFYVYRYYVHDKRYVKVNLIPVHEIIVFYGEYNNNPFSGTVSREALVHNGGEANATVAIDGDNNKIIFTLTQWSSIILMSTSPLTGVEID